jgi:hypothetical protein
MRGANQFYISGSAGFVLGTMILAVIFAALTVWAMVHFGLGAGT